MNDPYKPRKHPLEALSDHPQPTHSDHENEEVPPPSNVVNEMGSMPKPYVVWVLIAINSVIYVALLFGMNERQAFDIYQATWSNRGQVLGNGEYYRLFTAMFLHSYSLPMHIVFNMYALYAIGQSVNILFGHVRFIIIYILGGLLGSVLSVLLNTANTYSVGASGAVFAIFAAQIIYLYRNRAVLGKGANEQLKSSLIIVAINLAIGIFSSFGSGSSGSIDNWGHIGGFLGGAFLGWWLTPLYTMLRHPLRENTVIIRDGNPLEKRYAIIGGYVVALLVLLVVGHTIY